MCEQCMAKTATIGEVVPGIFLVRATVQGCHMEPNEFGLVESDDPFFTFSRTPTPHPYDGLSGDKVGARVELDGLGPILDWSKLAGGFSKRLLVELNVGWRVVQACLKAGYNPDEDGDAALWLFNRMGVLFQKWELKQ